MIVNEKFYLMCDLLLCVNKFHWVIYLRKKLYAKCKKREKLIIPLPFWNEVFLITKISNNAVTGMIERQVQMQEKLTNAKWIVHALM